MSTSENEANISIEFTLHEIFDCLNDRKFLQQLEIEKLIDQIQNIHVAALTKDETYQEVEEKRKIYLRSLKHVIENDIPQNYPFPNTKDVDENLIQYLNHEIKVVNEVNQNIENEIDVFEQEVQELTKKINGLKIMKDSFLNAQMTKINPLRNSNTITKKIDQEFKKVKNDLRSVVDIIFPENHNFDVLLGEITRAFTRGGDDVYINVEVHYRPYIKFLIEADIITYHPYDKNLVKLIDLI